MKRETKLPSHDHDCMKDPRAKRQRAEIRDLKARLAAVRPYIELLCVRVLSDDCACGECRARRASVTANKNWRKP